MSRKFANFIPVDSRMSSELLDAMVAASTKVERPKSKPKRTFRQFEVVVVVQVVDRLAYNYKRVTKSKLPLLRN